MAVTKAPSTEDREAIRTSVREHLERYGADYDTLANQTRALLDEYRATDEGRRAIYTIASRRDYQFGNRELKEIQSAVDKILDEREEEKAAGEDPSFGVDQLDDIIGFKVLCVYPSDVGLVQRHFRSLVADRRLIISKPFENKKKRSGYRAMHGVVTIPGTRAHLRCEIQVLTLLQEAWSCKTHDLTYKGENILSGDARDTALLSRFLHAVDDQSEAIKDTIRERMTRSEEERAMLVRTHLVNIFNGTAFAPADLDRDQDRSELMRFNREELSAEDALNQKLRTLVRVEREALLRAKTCRPSGMLVVSAADAYEAEYNIFPTRCAYETVHGFSLVYSLGAFCGNRSDNRGAACHYAARVVEHARKYSPEDIPGALIHQGWTEFCAGNYETAIGVMRDALAASREADDMPHIESALNDVCYFTACLLDKDPRRTRGAMNRSEREDRKEEALASIEEAIQSASRRLSGAQREARVATFEDSRGFLRIVSSTRIADVLKGIRECESTLNQAKAFPPEMQPLARLYTKNHIQRGWRKLVELSNRQRQN